MARGSKLETFGLREADDGDGDALAALIAGCFAEYDGCVFDRACEFPELDAIATHFRAAGGCMWVVEADLAVVGCLGVRPLRSDAIELLKVYVDGRCRGTGIAQELLAEAEAFARRLGASQLELWSDTRFLRGHRFYEKQGFERTGEKRFLNDLSDSWEYRFVRSVDRPFKPGGE